MLAFHAGYVGCPTCAHIVPKPQSQRVITCAAQRSSVEPERRGADAAKVVLSGLAAALLLQSAYVPSAEAGVVIEKSKNKKFFQGGNAKPKPIPEDAAKPASSGGGFSLPSFPTPSLPGLPGLPGAPSLPAPPSVSLTPPSGSFDPLTFVLPAVVGIIGLGGFLFSKLDVGFSEFFREAIVKDSGDFAGYEEKLKGQNEGFAGLTLPAGLPNPFAAGEEAASNGKKAVKSAKRTGTQALKPKKGSKGGSGGVLGGLFGRKK